MIMQEQKYDEALEWFKNYLLGIHNFIEDDYKLSDYIKQSKDIKKFIRRREFLNRFINPQKRVTILDSTIELEFIINIMSEMKIDSLSHQEYDTWINQNIYELFDNKYKDIIVALIDCEKILYPKSLKDVNENREYYAKLLRRRESIMKIISQPYGDNQTIEKEQ